MAENLIINGFTTYRIDGDVIRSQLKKSNSFSKNNILNNNYSIIELCKENLKSNDFTIVSVISPYKETRRYARKIFGLNYFEVYIKCSLNELLNRDTKGLYSKAIDGKVKNLIGVSKSNRYEKPINPELIIDTEFHTLEESLHLLLQKMYDLDIIHKSIDEFEKN